jgi:AraC family transcriptional regulator of adaptative response/methylated-DNA-[protein]-cysteine methyltransferase
MSSNLKTKSTHYQTIEKVIKYIDNNTQDNISIDELSQMVGMSKYHFIRVFKEYVGVSPLQFIHATTVNYAKERLKESSSILDTSQELNLSSSSRLHDMFVNIYSVTPQEYKLLGKKLTITYGISDTPFGIAMIGVTSRGICFLEFVIDDIKQNIENIQKLWKNADLIRDDKKIKEICNDIFIYNKRYNLFVKGTNFQVNVWKALINIPNKSMTSYQDIANSIKNPKATRAVASAIGSNHIAYLIPCHRVIAKSGAICGYKWGVDKKRVIIAYEHNI